MCEPRQRFHDTNSPPAEGREAARPCVRAKRDAARGWGSQRGRASRLPVATDRRWCAVQRIGFVLKVRKDRLEEYKARHREVWPEMLAALRETGWHNYTLFLREDGLLFGYLETPDFERAKAGMAGKEVNARWQAEMAPFFEALEGRAADESMMPLEEVFHLD
jgi:L-rhamnose mutarotase